MCAGSSKVGVWYLMLALIIFILVNGQGEFCERPEELLESAEGRCYETRSWRDRLEVTEVRYIRTAQATVALKGNLSFSYILYDINPPEGFNLRRDVYVRIAVFVKNLIQQEKEFRWHLVLPPWGNTARL